MVFTTGSIHIRYLCLNSSLWVVVISLQNPKGNRFFFVRLGIENLNPNLVIQDDPLDFVTLEVRGQSDKVAGLSSQQMRAFIDLREAKTGTSVYDVVVDRDAIPGEVEIVGWTPTRIGLTLERMVAKSVRIEPLVIGDVAEGYRLGEISVPAATAQIRGPESQLDKLTVIRTTSIDITGFSTSTVRRARLDVPKGVILVKPNLAEVKIEVAERYVERSFDVAVSVVGLLEGLESKVEPAQASLILYGPENTMDGVSDQDLSVSVDVKGLETGVYPIFATTRVPDPEHVSILQIKPSKFEVAIEEPVDSRRRFIGDSYILPGVIEGVIQDREN